MFVNAFFSLSNALANSKVPFANCLANDFRSGFSDKGFHNKAILWADDARFSVAAVNAL